MRYQKFSFVDKVYKPFTCIVNTLKEEDRTSKKVEVHRRTVSNLEKENLTFGKDKRIPFKEPVSELSDRKLAKFR